MPSSWKESEWENSVQAIGGAFNKNARYIEIDAQLNRHPNAVTSSTPYGILYTHHDARCEEINSSGQGTGVWRNIASDDPVLVDRCAERLSNVFNRWPYANRYIIEMKNDTGFTEWLPKTLYHLLNAKGWRTTVIVSSLNETLLTNLRNEAVRNGITMNLMRVFGYSHQISLSDMDNAVNKGFRYIAGTTFSSLSRGWTPGGVEDAKARGLYVVGWHWADAPVSTSNQQAVALDLDIMITDSISDLQQRGWQ